MTEILERPGPTEASAARASAWLEAFQSALSERDVPRATEMFATTSYWRDLVAFSWNITTVEHREGIADMLENTLDQTDPTGFTIVDATTDQDDVVTATFGFETNVGRGEGQLRLIKEGGDDKAFTLLTTMDELKGFEEPLRTRRPLGAEHGINKDRTTWKERRQTEAESLGTSTQPYVLVVGGGQCGIALGARLRQLNVPALVVDKHPRPGDQWRKRYKSLCLHDPVWVNHLPYLKFPDNWPVYTPKDKIGDWLESYVKIMEVPYWSDTEMKSASFSEATGEWTVVVQHEGQDLTLRPRHLVFATGMAGKPRIPNVPGADIFRGDIHHSSQHAGPDAYAGKKAVVIGSNNSAFDICGALWENNADVTMIQRSSTHIVKSKTVTERLLGDLYSERAVAAGVTTEKADLIQASVPYRILHQSLIPAFKAMAELDRDFYDRLERAGFWHDFGDDGSGMPMKYLRRGSGYYIDVGAAELVISGDVSLAHGNVHHFTEDTVVLDDGTEIPAELVVFATGYESMNGWVADLINQETADKLGKCWGLGSDTTKDPGPWEGELRNMWKPTQVPNLWMHGGNLQQSRYYSTYLALQLKARFEGLHTPVYRLAPVYHTS